MSREEVKKVIDEAVSDAGFRQRLLKNPDEVLSAYRDNLSAEELNGLKALTADVLEGIEASVDSARKSSPWWQPTSFKELGGAVLSVVLLGMMVFVLAIAASELSSDPRGVQIGNATQIVDDWERAKDLIAIFFPLFGAVVAFWLGVAVEGRRADENKQTATEAKQSAEVAESRVQALLGEAPPDVVARVRERYRHLF